MTSLELDKVYDVPCWRAADGSTWHKELHALHFVGQHGWAVGSGQILRSQDGGKTWINQIPKRMSRGITIPERVATIDHRTAWVLMLGHRPMNNCYYTRDGGNEWKEKRLPSLVHP